MRQSVPGVFGLSQVFSGWETDECPKSRRRALPMTGSFLRILSGSFVLPRRLLSALQTRIWRPSNHGLAGWAAIRTATPHRRCAIEPAFAPRGHRRYDRPRGAGGCLTPAGPCRDEERFPWPIRLTSGRFRSAAADNCV